MEFVEGWSLAELVQRKGPLTIALACNFIRQAALGLQHAFEQGMVHRDIKPANLMLTPQGRVKILDFGLARFCSENAKGSELTEIDSFLGTPDYVSPEQATDARTADTRADLYSLGCTLYFLLTGRPPFQEDTVVKLVLAQIEKEPPPLHELRPELSPDLCTVAARLLAKDPARRYQKPVELAQVLMPFLKPGSDAGVAKVAIPPQGVESPTAGTVSDADTSKLRRLRKDVVEKSPAKNLTAASAVPRRVKKVAMAATPHPQATYWRWMLQPPPIPLGRSRAMS